MNLIFLSWAYPPMRYPRATQVARLAHHIKHRPFELYCLAHDDGRMAFSIEEKGDIVITRIPPSLAARTLARLMPSRRDAIFGYDAAIYWWKRAAAAVADSSVPGPNDILVTFGQPMSDHLAGMRLKREFGMHWIAHFSDPWADNPFLKGTLARKRASRRERRVIGAADALIFVSPEARDLVMAKYPEDWRRKAHVLPHAFEPALYPNKKPEGDKLVLRYLGNFYGERGPEPLYRALGALRERDRELFGRIRVELIGSQSPRHRQSPALAALAVLAPEMVAIKPPVSYAESLALMKTADVLLTIDAPFKTSVFLPSKLVDYIGAERPIVGLTPPGAAARVIRELGGWVAPPGDSQEGAAAIESALVWAQANRGASWGDRETRREYTVTAVATGFENIVDQLRREGS